MADPSTTTQRPRLLYLAMPLAVVSFALSPILIRYAMAAEPDASAVAIALWRTLFASLALAPFAWRRARPEWKTWTRADAGRVLAAGGLLGLHFIFWIYSLFFTSVASASVLVTTSPIFLAILGYLLLGERLKRSVVVVIVIAVLGSAVISWADASGHGTGGSMPLLGNMLALGASLVATGYLLLGRVVRRHTSWLAYVFPLYAVAALTALLAMGIGGVPLFGYGWDFYGWCLLMAIFPQLIGHGTFNYAVAYFPAALVSLLALLEPIGASVMAYFLFGEVPGVWAVVGMAVVLGALASLVWLRNRNG